tara:strand:+ start:356 stop:1150 length:795 start_codon:yes stop_codon:yes gene_type:complete
MEDHEISKLNFLDGRAKAFISLNGSVFLDHAFSVSSIIFANEILMGESVLSGAIENQIVFKVNASLLCIHASRTLGSCNTDTNSKPYGFITDLNDTKYTDSHLIGKIPDRSSQFVRESFISTPSYDEKDFKNEMNERISSGEISPHLFSELDEIFSEINLFPLTKSKNLSVEIINAAMSLSILCKSGLKENLPLLYYDLECGAVLEKYKLKSYSDLENFIFNKFWSGAYFSVVRGIRNLEYSSHEGSMVVGSLYSNLLRYEGRL